ncbi:MAG: hypothetical protein KC766_00455 [Myxococcales bacterium]|nr:hypothetical protein [Myxococcales bacterium]
MTPEQLALVARLDGFVAQLQQRLQAIFAEATAGIDALMHQRPGELVPIRNALSGVEALAKQLTRTLQDTWDQRIEPMFRPHGERFLTAGEHRKEEARQDIEQAVTRFRLEQESRCLGAMYPAVQVAISQARPCTNCGAPLRLAVPYEAESLSCSSCGVINQLMPEALVRNYFLFGQEIFPAAAAHPVRVEIERAERLMDRELRESGQKETLESRQQREALERKYWETYAAAKGSFLGRPPETALIESRMAQFREGLRS